MSGLYWCYFDKWEGPECTEKSIQLIMLVCFLAAFGCQIFLHVRRQCHFIRVFRMKLLIMMLGCLSLMMNGVHNFSNRVLYSQLQNFFFNLYYLNIVFYAWHRLIEKMYEDKRKPLIVMRIVYSMFILVYVALLTLSIVVTTSACQQVWYLVVRILDLMLSVIFLIVGRINHIRQIKKMQQLTMVSKINNPLNNLWIWIGVNMLSQLANTVQSAVFISLPSDQCSYADDLALNYAVTFIMLCITYYASFASTLWVFWEPLTCCHAEDMMRAHSNQTDGIELHRLDWGYSARNDLTEKQQGSPKPSDMIRQELTRDVREEIGYL